MAADHHHHHQNHRPHRISVPPRTADPAAVTPSTTARLYPQFSYPPSTTPTPTPSKHRLSSVNRSSTRRTTSLSFLFLLLFSLRSLYSLLPFLQSSPSSFSIFPFSFLVSLLSFLLTLIFSIFIPSSSKDHFLQKQSQPNFTLSSINQSQWRLLVSKSLMLAIVFLLRFQALRYCGTAAMILAELSGNAAARFMAESRKQSRDRIGSQKVGGFFLLFIGLSMLSISWDRIECFPFSYVNIEKIGVSMIPNHNCLRFWAMLLPFLSGFLGCYDSFSMNWTRELGVKRVRLITLWLTTVLLFIPAVISMFVFEADGESISIRNLGWPLANTVIFGVLLSEICNEDKLTASKGLFHREFLITFLCTLLLELFYFPELSLLGLLISGFLLWIAVRQLDSVYRLELGFENSESFRSTVMKPIRHILSERKSRKIALFLLINTAYMVVEFVAGFMSNSLGLITDACHMLFDCLALAIGLYASYISRLPANSQFNYGRGRFEVLSGYTNAVFLVLVGALIVLESIERILDPQEISTNSLLTVSIGGLLVNIIGLIFFHEEHHHAHGGVGSCSHSHSQKPHLDSNHQNHHHEHEHDHDHDHNHHQHIPDHNHHQHIPDHNHDKHAHHQHDHDKHAHHQHDHDKHDHHQHDHDKHAHHQHEHDHNHHQHEHDHHGHDHNHHQHEHDHHGHDHNHHQHEHDHHGHDHNHHQHEHDHHGHDHNHHQHEHEHNHHYHDHNVHEHEHDDHSHDHHHDHHSHDCGTHKEVEEKKLKRRKNEHKHIDHNMEGIFLHVLADTMGSVGVVISTLLIKYKGWLVADPACSIFISVLIISSVIPLLRNSAEILLQRVPRGHEEDLKEAVNEVTKIKGGACSIQKLNVWSFTNTDVVSTLHLRVNGDVNKADVKAEVLDILGEAGLKDVTLQVEWVI